nr:MAG TPA: hypothetical protein [Caudoviricetes sp.]
MLRNLYNSKVCYFTVIKPTLFVLFLGKSIGDEAIIPYGSAIFGVYSSVTTIGVMCIRDI